MRCFKIVFMLLLLFQVLSSGTKSGDFNNIFVTNKIEGDKVVFNCEYFQKYTIDKVYSIEEESNRKFIVITLDGNKYFVYQNVISIDILTSDTSIEISDSIAE
ncbi:MAG: hypothetical protein WCR80_06815 [Bacilli bacterium]